MSTDTALTVPTRLVEADGVRFAYRRWGKPGWFPLVFLNYFTGNLDNWDPLVTDGFAADYDVILFDNAGVGSSGGETPGTVAEMTRHTVAFCDALGLKEFYVVGFSLGGTIAQQLALDHPDLVKRMLLLGTGPRGGEGMTFTELSSEERVDPDRFLLSAFFSPTDSSQAAGRAYLKRLAARTTDRDRPVSPRTAEAQLHAIREWGAVPSSNRYASLKKHQAPNPRRARHQGHRGAPDQRFHPSAAPAGCAAHHVSRLKPRCDVSTRGLLETREAVLERLI